MICLHRIMQTSKALEIVQKIYELTDKFNKYLRILFDEWAFVVPVTIREKIIYPLFKINDDQTININFAKEVIYFIVYNEPLNF